MNEYQEVSYEMESRTRLRQKYVKRENTSVKLLEGTRKVGTKRSNRITVSRRNCSIRSCRCNSNRDYRIDNQQVVWDFLPIRRMWSTAVLDHKWVRAVLVSVGDRRARKRALFMGIVLQILGPIFAAEDLLNLRTTC